MTSSAIRFEAQVVSIEDTVLVRIPDPASANLPSRGQVAGRATIAGVSFPTVVEPDGRRGHWIRIDQDQQQVAGIVPGDEIEVSFTVSADWPEPDVPDDLARALAAARERIRIQWQDITPMARWEWVRWVQATANAATRERRVEVSVSKLDNGKRRPCCFDLSSCTDPRVARSGKLRPPSSA